MYKIRRRQELGQLKKPYGNRNIYKETVRNNNMKTAKTCKQCGEEAETKYGRELEFATYDFDIWAICKCGNKWLFSTDY